MRTLLEPIQRIQDSGSEAIRFHSGYRTWVHSWAELSNRIGGFAAYLEQRGIEKGDRILLWGENRPEWVVAFWGSVVRGVQVVPIDFRSSARFVKRIQEEVQAKLLVHGDSLNPAPETPECLPFD
jgi:acyl-CoA synthetase (AMP-forming)/AMP-acid ligase II